MRFGFALRLMGAAATAETIKKSAHKAENVGLDTLWVPDHIAIPTDEAEGSNGRYLDPLASLSWLAASTTRIGLGTAVLILPYRPILPTAKVVATIQELSGGRLSLGVGVGWMDAEFEALGVDRHARGRITDETLAFFADAFGAENDEVELNGRRFLFRPRPQKPPRTSSTSAAFAGAATAAARTMALLLMRAFFMMSLFISCTHVFAL